VSLNGLSEKRPAPVARGEESQDRRARDRDQLRARHDTDGRLRACYWVNAKPWTLGATLGGGLFFFGVGLVGLGQVPHASGPFVEERHVLANSEADRNAFAAAIVERGGSVMKRRKMLGGLLAGGLGIFGVVAMFPTLRSLGPLPKGTLFHTDWRKDSYVVDQTGRRGLGGRSRGRSIVTVFPEGTQDSDRGQAVDQTVLIRVSNEKVHDHEGP